LLADVPDGSYAYFVHSYYVLPADDSIVLATTDYGVEFASVVGRDNVFGAQFHPEKSQEVGLRILRNFVEVMKERPGELEGTTRNSVELRGPGGKRGDRISGH